MGMLSKANLSGKPHLEEDLLKIREDLAEEWGAAIGYLECSVELKDPMLREEFHDAAQDEIRHISSLTRMLATLDQVQSEALNGEGLFWLSGFEHQAAVPQVVPKEIFRDETVCYSRQGKQTAKKYYEFDDINVECLRNAIRDELMAINVYQRQAWETSNVMVQNTLISIMNQKKAHVAKFSACLNKILREYRLPLI